MTSTAPVASAWYFTAGASGRTARGRTPYARASPASPSARPMKSAVKPAARCAALAREVARACADDTARAVLAAHRDRVAVLEAERRQPSHAVPRRELARDVREHAPRIARERIGERVVQHREQPRARVLGIDVDRAAIAAPESRSRSRRAPAADRRCMPRASSSCANISREQIRLAERLRRDDDRRDRDVGVRRSARDHAAPGRIARRCSARRAIASRAVASREPSQRRRRRERALEQRCARTASPATTRARSIVPALLDAPRAHHHQLVRETRRLGQIVRHQQRRERELVAQRVERRLQIRARDRIERAERLVHAAPRRGARRARARAPTRCRCPPESSCGNRAPNRSAGSPTSASVVGRHGARVRHVRAASARARRCAERASAASSPPSCGT